MKPSLHSACARPITALLLTASAALVSAPVSIAHDFWLAPNTYKVDTPRPIAVDIMIGHPEDSLRWTVNPHRIVALRSVSQSGIDDQQGAMNALLPGGSFMIETLRTGTNLLTIETTSAFSDLPADKFNAYLAEEGLTPIAQDRERKGTQDQNGTEIYSRRGKALIQVGDLSPQDPDFLTRPLGMTLEIVPSAHPMRLKAGEPMTSTSYYRGAPTSGITIGLIDLSGDRGLIATAKTDNAGRVTFPRPQAGAWMLHAVWSDALEDTTKADYDTIFSSLSFAVE